MRAVRAECTLASSLSPRLVVVLSSLLSLPMSSASNEREVTLTQFRDTIYRLVGYEASSLEEDGWMNWRGRSHNQFPFPFRFQWEDEREGGSGCQCHLPSFLPSSSSLLWDLWLIGGPQCQGLWTSLLPRSTSMFWWPLTAPSELGGDGN